MAEAAAELTTSPCAMATWSWITGTACAAAAFNAGMFHQSHNSASARARPDAPGSVLLYTPGRSHSIRARGTESIEHRLLRRKQDRSWRLQPGHMVAHPGIGQANDRRSSRYWQNCGPLRSATPGAPVADRIRTAPLDVEGDGRQHRIVKIDGRRAYLRAGGQRSAPPIRMPNSSSDSSSFRIVPQENRQGRGLVPNADPTVTRQRGEIDSGSSIMVLSKNAAGHASCSLSHAQ